MESANLTPNYYNMVCTNGATNGEKTETLTPKVLPKIEITITQELKPTDINDLVSTALEGGINYWCGRAGKKRNADKSYFGVAKEDEDKIEFASDLIGYGGTLVLYDAESSDKWELTLEKMLKGIKTHCEKKGITPLELMDNYDADDADCIVQYACFDEITFC